MIIHASKKLDISLYVDWLIKRIEEGFFDKELDEKTINRYILKNIEKIFLYTRNPSKIYRNREFFKNYNTELITFITLYDQFYEPKIKDKDIIINSIKKCSKYFDNYIAYGPIFFTNNHNEEWHIKQFDFICASLSKFIKGIYLDFSINESCQKSSKTNAYKLTKKEQIEITKKFEKISLSYGLKILSLKEESSFSEKEIDLGLNNCCPNICEYCNHISNKKAATDKYQIFDKKNTLLYGSINKNQKIVEIEIEKPICDEKNFNQISLMDFI